MTEKRFTKLLEKEFMIYDNWESKQITDYDTVTDLLNALSDENVQLKNLCKTLINEIEKRSIVFIIDKDIRRLLE